MRPGTERGVDGPPRLAAGGSGRFVWGDAAHDSAVSALAGGRGVRDRVHGKGLGAGELEPVRPGIEPSDYAGNFRQFLGERAKGTPFCFWLGSKEPHRVYDEGSGLRLGKKLEDAQVPEFLPDTPEVRSDLLDYYLEIEWYDAQLGKTLRILEETGELENTLIVVTSDNGMPFPHAKVSLYDWGVRMPLAVRWGAKLQRGRVVEDLVSHTDFAPTFLAAAGVAQPTGMAVFSGMERHTMCRAEGAGYPMRSMRTAEFLYIKNYAPDRWPTGGAFLSSNKTAHGDIDAAPTKEVLLGPTAATRFPKQVEWCLAKRPAEELYEVGPDPGQVKNLAGDARYAGQRDEMRARLKGYLEETGDPRAASFNTSLPEEVREAARTRKTHKPE